jgi:ABC-2 type transport system ATP-binding protein
MDAVTISNLTKLYGKQVALDSISLSIPQGQIYGLLGPNGAGKTTLIKSLVGSLKPTKGEITVLGLNPLKDKAKLRQILGYMPQSVALYEDLSARENITFFAELHHLKNSKSEVESVLEFTELTDRANDLIATFSGGMQKRVSLACSLIHQPKILFLDEPTAAVDPYLKEKLWKLFRNLAKEGTTLIISTHLMDEAMLCDQVSIIRNGHIIISDTPQHIIQKGKTKLKVTQEKIDTTIIESTPEKLAEKLWEYGLDKKTKAVELISDNLEDVLLTIIEEDKKK